jgi:hypothetical protein
MRLAKWISNSSSVNSHTDLFLLHFTDKNRIRGIVNNIITTFAISVAGISDEIIPPKINSEKKLSIYLPLCSVFISKDCFIYQKYKNYSGTISPFVLIVTGVSESARKTEASPSENELT